MPKNVHYSEYTSSTAPIDHGGRKKCPRDDELAFILGKIDSLFRPEDGHF